MSRGERRGERGERRERERRRGEREREEERRERRGEWNMKPSNVAPGPVTQAPTQLAMDPNSGDFLAGLEGVYVKQVRNAAEAFCGFEVANQYEIYQLNPVEGVHFGPEIIHAKEQGDRCCYRNFCGPCRANKTDIYLAQGTEIMLGTYTKSQGLSWCGIPCCKAGGSVKTMVPGSSQGEYATDDPAACPGCTPLRFSLQNYDFDGPRSCCVNAPCVTYAFTIKDQRNQAMLGRLVKESQGCRDMIYKTNKFSVVFPPGANSEDKVIAKSERMISSLYPLPASDWKTFEDTALFANASFPFLLSFSIALFSFQVALIAATLHSDFNIFEKRKKK